MVLQGQLLLTEEGIGRLVQLANLKFNLNAARTERLMEVGMSGGVHVESQKDARGSSWPYIQTLQRAFQQEAEGKVAGRESNRKAKAKQKWEEKARQKREKKEEKKAAAKGEKEAWQWIEPRVVGDDPRWLLRWGHTLSPVSRPFPQATEHVDRRVYWMYGGYGWAGPGERLGRLDSVIEVQVREGLSSSTPPVLSVQLVPIPSSSYRPQPEAREKHAAVSIQVAPSPWSIMLVFGGRASPSRAFNDLWSFDRTRYSLLPLSSVPIEPRRHWRDWSLHVLELIQGLD